jgi:hypothetical protein
MERWGPLYYNHYPVGWAHTKDAPLDPLLIFRI